MIKLELKQLPHGEGLPPPQYQSEGAAGMDLVAAIDEDKPIKIEPFDRSLIPTAVQIALPEGYEAQIRPRSGLALKQGITVLNSPGTIDWDYRGEIKVLLINLGEKPVTISRGERIAQMVIAPVVRLELTIVDALSETTRAEAGFGSTGSK